MGKPRAALSMAERVALDAMANGGSLYVYTGEHGPMCPGPWPEAGEGAIVYDGPPMKVSRRIVSRIHEHGTDWCDRARAWKASTHGALSMRLSADGRDVLKLASTASGMPEVRHG